jgi:predicted RecB family nuclease
MPKTKPEKRSEMNAKITRDVLESRLHCKYKAFLKLTGQQGAKSEYETFLTTTGAEARLVTIDRVFAAHANDEVARHVPLTTAILKRGLPFIFDATLEADGISLLFDGLKKVDGASKLGDFHYVPILFHQGPHVRQEQKRLLELYAMFLSPFQEKAPASGIIWQGHTGKTTKVHLSSEPRRAEQLLRDLKNINTLELPPKLILNDHCQICEYRQRCHAQALQEDNISLLRGMGEKEINRYSRKGIFTVTQLSCTFRARKQNKRDKRCGQPRYLALQAMAIRDKRIYVLGTPTLPSSATRVYLDVEGDLSGGFVYLIGVTVEHQGEHHCFNFWASHESDEELIFSKFADVVRQYEQFTVFHYGSYEIAFLKRMRHQADQQPLIDFIDKLLANSFNVLSSIYSHIYFPTYSNGLKEVGKYLGCTWKESDATGLQSVLWRARWETAHDDALKHRLIMYNADDVAALERITESVYQMADTRASKSDEPRILWHKYAFAPVEELSLQTGRREYGTPTFALPDFEHINKAAYFDYQRDKVFLRTNTTLRKLHSCKLKKRPKAVRPNERIEISCDECPFCKHRGLSRYANMTHVKLAYDLKITRTGIRRRVIECVALTHRCQQCNKHFVPPHYKKRDKHCHGLKSWAMYHHIEHRVSFARLEGMINECFDLRVDSGEFHMVKTLMAKRYRETYGRILSTIISGKIIHIDETQVKLQRGKGYVWVLTNLEEVVYLYRPSREGEFLQKLLKDFTGVLISDFYAAYDSLLCKQQKCLIHLMRDMNHDLLQHSYDDEYKWLAGEFGLLLKLIVLTIDKYGLKKRHLTKHASAVERYFRLLTGRAYSSELAESYRKRLLKNQDTLFTFLNHDGVPWNNNNAEHAIKHFAYYRVIADGMMTEAGLEDYLVLLSICQTCKYKGLSFLKFLLSQEVDVDRVVSDGKCGKASASSLDLYPDGFSPSHHKRMAGSNKVEN